MIFFRSSGMPHALRIVWITLHHLGLSASCLDSLLGRSGESRSLDSDLLGHLAVAQNLVAIARTWRGCPSPAAPRTVTVSPSSNAFRALRLTISRGFAKMLLKPRLGMRRARGIWPPSKPTRTLPPERAFWPLWPRPPVLPLPEPAPRPFRYACPDGALGGRQFAQLHNSVPPYFTSVTCSR